MKSKVVLSADAPFSLAFSINWRFRRWLFSNVVVPKFHADPHDKVNWGPAACYNQFCDYCDPADGSMISYNLSGITLREDRDFETATSMIIEEIIKRVRERWKGVRVHVMLVIHASSADGTKSMLIEPPPFYIDTTDLKPSFLEPVWKFFRLGWRALCHA